MQKVQDIIEIIEEFAPLSLQMSYDNCGLIYGDKSTALTGVLITLDVTPEVVKEAIDSGCNMIVSHHPLIFKAIQKIDTAYATHKALVLAIKNDIAIYASHTNVDFAVGGLNDALMASLGATDVEFLVEGDITSGRIGNLSKAHTLQSFAEEVQRVTGDKNVTTVGDINTEVKRIAVINGSGGGSEDTILQAKEAGADIFITSELKYSVVRLAKDINYGIIGIGHYDSEIGFIDLISNLLKSHKIGAICLKSARCTNPYN